MGAVCRKWVFKLGYTCTFAISNSWRNFSVDVRQWHGRMVISPPGNRIKVISFARNNKNLNGSSDRNIINMSLISFNFFIMLLNEEHE